MKLRIDGHDAYAYTGGKPFDPALPCIVFLHGACNDHSVFTLLARWFAHHGHAVLAADLPGHMRSEGPLLDGVERLGAWALALLDAAGVRRAAWVGHSLGSLIALEAAAQAPERAARLVMIGTAYPMKVGAALLEAAESDPVRGMAQVTAWSISRHSSKPGFPGPGCWLHGGNLALMRRVQAGHPGANLFRHDFLLCDRYAGAADAAARIRCPVAFILGEKDAMTPPKAARDLGKLLRAQIHTVACGHHAMGEAPEATLEVLRRVIGQPSGAAALA